MEFTKLSCEEFVSRLAGKDPVPGGGGASALLGALSCALGNMVGSLTVGKKKYADVEEEILSLKERITALQDKLLGLIDADAEAFAPLAAAYSLPKETPEQQARKEEVMEAALKEAAAVPMEILRSAAAGVELLEVFAEKGSRLALSDAGVAASFAAAAMRGAALNVFINTKLMKDREEAERLNKECNALLEGPCRKADQLYEKVKGELYV